MAGHNSDRDAADQRARMSASGIPVGLLIAAVIAPLALLGIGRGARAALARMAA